MKKITKCVLVLILCVSLCGCAPLQATLADSLESLYGVEGKSYEEHMAYYQAEWDMLFGDLGKVLGIAADEAEELVVDAVEEAIEDVFSHSFVDWENITEQDKVTLANIKDEDGYTESYDNRFEEGQCTWYAYGRMKEKTGIELDVYGNAKDWINMTPNDEVDVETDIAKIKPNSVAVFHKPGEPGHWGHVVFVEHVTYDENGNPDKVYYTECNMDAYRLKDGSRNPKWGVYNEGDDCIVKSADYEEFVSRGGGSHKCLGYLIPKK